jgi:HEAT repeat protein
MAVSTELKTLVDQMPNPDGKGMYTENIDKEVIEKAIAEIYEGGRANVVGLIEMLGEPGSQQDVKPRYALRCLANHVLAIKNEEARKELSVVLAAALLSDRPNHVKRFLCQELQWAGGEEAVPALGKLLLDEELVEPATMALLAIRQGAAEQFRAALPNTKDKCRLNVIQALGDVKDVESIDSLKSALRDPDREVRLAAGWGLSRMGDAGSVDLLISESDARSGWERIQATKHCLVLAEQLAAADKKDLAGRIYIHLRDTRTDAEEQYVREAAERALRTA